MASKKLIEIEELNCPICQEKYNGNQRNPRILKCGHTFCTECLRAIIEESEELPLCPDCRTQITAIHVESISICYLVKKIIDSVNELNKNILKENDTHKRDSPLQQKTRIPSNVSKKEVNSKLKFHGQCDEHDAPNHMWCNTCSVSLCGTCVFTNSHSGPEDNCTFDLLEDALQDLYNENSRKISNQTLLLSHIYYSLRTFVKIFGSEHLDSIKKLNDKIEIIYDDLSLLKETSSYIKSCKAIQDRLDSFTYVKNLFEAKKYPQPQEEILRGLWSNFLNTKKEFILGLVYFDQIPLMVCSNLKGKKITAPVVKDQQRLLVCSLVDDDDDLTDYDKEPLYFHISDLVASNKYVFLELCDKEERNLGMVVILLFEESQRARHFRTMCTGEQGVSYQDTYFIEDRGLHMQYLGGGDYEHNNGSGGRAVLNLDPTLYEINIYMREGIVCGPSMYDQSRLAQFKIFYSVREFSVNTMARGALGIVVDNLNLIKFLSNSGRWSEVKIYTCGLLFYTED